MACFDVPKEMAFGKYKYNGRSTRLRKENKETLSKSNRTEQCRERILALPPWKMWTRWILNEPTHMHGDRDKPLDSSAQKVLSEADWTINYRICFE